MSTASDLPSSDPLRCPDDAALAAPAVADGHPGGSPGRDSGGKTAGSAAGAAAGAAGSSAAAVGGPEGSPAASPETPASRASRRGDIRDASQEVASAIAHEASLETAPDVTSPAQASPTQASPAAASGGRLVLLDGEEAVRLVTRHQAGVWRYLRAMGCNPEEADDLTQDTFVAVLRRPFTDHGELATSAYLRRVAHNRLISVRRKLSRQRTVSELEELDTVWDRLGGGDQGEAMLEALQLCLKALSDRSRRALEMRFRGRVSRAHIAEALQITEHGVKNLMQRAKEKLRVCIERRIS